MFKFAVLNICLYLLSSVTATDYCRKSLCSPFNNHIACGHSRVIDKINTEITKKLIKHLFLIYSFFQISVLLTDI